MPNTVYLQVIALERNCIFVMLPRFLQVCVGWRRIKKTRPCLRIGMGTWPLPNQSNIWAGLAGYLCSVEKPMMASTTGVKKSSESLTVMAVAIPRLPRRWR